MNLAPLFFAIGGVATLLLLLALFGLAAALRGSQISDIDSLVERALANLRAVLVGAALLYVGAVISQGAGAQARNQEDLRKSIGSVKEELSRASCPDVHIGDFGDFVYSLTDSGIEFPPFQSGQDCWQSPVDKQLVEEKLAQLNAAIDTQSGRLVTIWIEGSFDYRPLGTSNGEFGGSNVALARKRAQCLERHLRERFPTMAQNVEIRTTANGPQMTRRDTLDSPDLDLALAADRSVRVFLGLQSRKPRGEI